MTILPKQIWQEVYLYTWEQLNEHQWLDFRMALADTETVMISQGVRVVTSGSSLLAEGSMALQGIKIEFSKSIHEVETEMVSSVVVSNRDYLSNMLKYLPLYERKSAVFQAILKAADREFRTMEQLLNSGERNIFIDTAIEDLYYYERDLAIKTQMNLKYDQRREQISARTRAAFDQTTLETIKSVANAFSNGDVNIHTTDISGVYECEFVGTIGIPNNMEGLQEAIDLIMPAHLEMTYKFNFQVWSKWNKKQWSSVKIMAWDELRTKGEV